MRNSVISILALGLTVLFTACSAGRPDAADVSLQNLPRERVSLPLEWRDAWRMPAGAHRVDLGPIPENSALRLGVCLEKDAPGPARIEVYADRKRTDRFEIPADGAWHDLRSDFGWRSGSGRVCKVVLDSPKEFCVGPFELLQEDASKPNILVLLIDTLRQDHLKCYFYPLDTSPSLDKLSVDGIRFWRLVPSSSWTRPSVASLFTSAYPNVHGAQTSDRAIRPGLPRIAAALGKAGYETQGFTGNPHCLPDWGFADGFDRYFYAGLAPADPGWQGDVKIVDKTIEALHHTAGRPWFYYVHLMGPHQIYDPPAEYADRFMPERFVGTRAFRRVQKDMALYDAEIANADMLSGRLFDTLRELGLYDNTLVVALSDHGEQFMEHGDIGHGCSLHWEELSVPLIVKLPRNVHAGEERKALVEMVDIAPTLLDLAGAAPEAGFQGQSFRGLFDKDPFSDRVAYANLRLGRQVDMSMTEKEKYIFDVNRRESTWYSLDEDPREFFPLRKPTPDGMRLASYAARMGVRQAPGLHLLVTCPAGHSRTVEASVSGPVMDVFQSAAHGATATVEGNSASGAIALRAVYEEAPSLSSGVPWVRLHAQIAEEAPLALTLCVDGAPVDPGDVFAGAEQRHVPLDGSPLDLASLAAPPRTLDDSSFPGRFAVYVWYVSPEDTKAPRDILPETQQMLQALGYLE